MRRSALIFLVSLAPLAVHADPADLCATAGNDDTLRPYDRRLRPEFVRAYKHMFPTSHGVPADPMLEANAVSRCMDGRLFVCFAGGVMPCGKVPAPTLEADERGFARARWTPLD